MLTYYNLLGVDADADAEEIQRAYHRKAQLLHPDRHATSTDGVRREAESAMKTINEAWNTLKDPNSRQQYDAEHGLQDNNGDLPDDFLRSGGERAPADDECELCGSGPAAPVVLRQETGKIIWRTRRRLDGTFCRDCGVALFRSTQNRTLMTGWWGVLSFFVNIASVLGNIAAWWKIRRLDNPRRDPTVVSYLDSPLDRGSPLYRRAGIWFAAVVILIFGSVAAAEANQEDDYYTPSYSGSSGSGYTPTGRSSGPTSYGYTSSNTWSEADKSEMRSAGVRAGMSYYEADCVVRYLTTRFSPSDYIGDSAMQSAANQCF